jgi:hypothetical protein
MSGARRFLQGLLAGSLATLALVALLAPSGDGSADWAGGLGQLQDLLPWAQRNLGYSLPAFAVVLALFLASLGHLRRLLRAQGPAERVAQADHLSDVWTHLFFGIGVIWTAIGMRDALLHALGDPAGAAQAGAFAILQRLVDGGMLVALTTTVFGGIGGYLMRVLKVVSVGAELEGYYQRAAAAQGDAIHATLTRIEASLRANWGTPGGAQPHSGQGQPSRPPTLDP